MSLKTEESTSSDLKVEKRKKLKPPIIIPQEIEYKSLDDFF